MGLPWYADSGAGQSVLLALHPGGTDSSALRPLLEGFPDYRVIVPDRRGHGRSADTGLPWTFEAMADDMAAVLDHLGLERVHVFGWSDGAIVGLHLLLRRPDLVRSLVFGGAVADRRGWREGVLDGDPPVFMADAYAAVSPDGRDHWSVVVGKARLLHRSAPQIPLESLAGVRSPVLLLSGDDDEARFEHLLALYETLPDAELAIVPRSTHGLIVEKPDLVARLVREFHDPLRSNGLAPIRRRVG